MICIVFAFCKKRAQLLIGMIIMTMFSLCKFSSFYGLYHYLLSSQLQLERDNQKFTTKSPHSFKFSPHQNISSF